MKKKKFLLLMPAFLLTACGPKDESPLNPFSTIDQWFSSHFGNNEESFHQDQGIGSETSDTEIEIKIDDDVDDVEITDSEIGEITTIKDGISYDITNKVFNISAAGEFSFKGQFEGNILVNAGDDDEVKISLEGFTIKSNTDSPIKCVNASELQVSIKKGTENFVYDTRSIKTEDNDAQGNGAITSDCDLKLSGKGSLTVIGNYNNGIHTKDDLKIKPEVNNNSSVQIKAVNNCLKGNDSIEIESGNMVLISTGGNAVKTENTDVSSKGKQRGTISIAGGHLDIYSAKDAIEASYNIEISKVEGGDDPIINIYTSKYSEYTSNIIESSDSKLYIKTSSNIGNYFFGVEYLNSNYETYWTKATAITSGQGGFSRSYYYQATRPSGATSFKLCLFANSVTDLTEENATSKMGNFATLSTSYDTVNVSASTSSITTSGWSNYQSSQQGGPGGGPGGGMNEGNNDKADYSAKGIKAENEIILSAGKYFIKSYDDGIHANNGTALENGSTGVGNVKISGGTYEIYSADDAIHADNTLTISDGTIDVKNAYEGLEANFINIDGGYTKVYATDDGINASKKINQTPQIKVTGGILDVTVNGQDVDGIDSNGSFLQTGGVVITKGAGGGMSTGLDTDGTATINGGTFIAFGKTEKTPTKGSGINSYTLSISGSGVFTIALPDGSTLQTETKYSHGTVYVYSDSSTKITITK